jgi:hypothetical protein
MKAGELLGRCITDIQVKQLEEPYGLDIASSYLKLDNGLVSEIPWKEVKPNYEVGIEEIPAKAESVKKLLKDKSKPLLNQPITDLIYYQEEIRFEKAFIELANGYVISEITIAPNGTGSAGLWYFESIQVLETTYGKNYTRLTNIKGSA